MMPAIKLRLPPPLSGAGRPCSSAAADSQSHRTGTDSAQPVETLGVVIDNWIQSSTNAAAAAADAAGSVSPAITTAAERTANTIHVLEGSIIIIQHCYCVFVS